MTERLKWATVKQIKEAAEELKAIVRAEYPDAQFILSRAPDDQHIWLLWTYVDIEDPEVLRDLTSDFEADLLMERNMLLHMAPVRGRPETVSRGRIARKTG